ncbi:10205_t:CDS:2 [Ambispora gerdemannii]|uniref:10205_t:CDS:1 n=1 Tax=Ambispora gerdemannii TaxID=144530 RepID=A0A9N9FHB5_9GLOM|nr:10205_t:CDS:2 [Ambispora gerdemannii]
MPPSSGKGKRKSFEEETINEPCRKKAKQNKKDRDKSKNKEATRDTETTSTLTTKDLEVNDRGAHPFLHLPGGGRIKRLVDNSPSKASASQITTIASDFNMAEFSSRINQYVSEHSVDDSRVYPFLQLPGGRITYLPSKESSSTSTLTNARDAFKILEDELKEEYKQLSELEESFEKQLRDLAEEEDILKNILADMCDDSEETVESLFSNLNPEESSSDITSNMGQSSGNPPPPPDYFDDNYDSGISVHSPSIEDTLRFVDDILNKIPSGSDDAGQLNQSN